MTVKLAKSTTNTETLPAIDIRTFKVEVRATNAQGLPTEVDAKVLTYGTVDAYGTRWKKGSVTKSLERRLPPMLFAHKPDLPIGRAIDFKEFNNYLKMTFRFDDPDFVPMARQAAYQLKEKTVDEFSIGFVRKEWTELDPAKNKGAYEEMTEADVVETSVVPFGAVTGTGVMGMRALLLASGVRIYVPERERITVTESRGTPIDETRVDNTDNSGTDDSNTSTDSVTDDAEPTVKDTEAQDQSGGDGNNTGTESTETADDADQGTNDNTTNEPRIITIPVPGTVEGATFARKDGQAQPKTIKLTHNPNKTSAILKERIAAREAKAESKRREAELAKAKAEQKAKEARVGALADDALAHLRSDRRRLTVSGRRH